MQNPEAGYAFHRFLAYCSL